MSREVREKEKESTKAEEIKQLKALKRDEIMQKIKELEKITGTSGMYFHIY